MTIEKYIVIAKIDLMGKYLERLQRFESVTLEQYLNDGDMQLVVERLLQLIIQMAIDLNRYFLKELGFDQPETNAEAFHAVSQCGIIHDDLAKNIAGSVSLRNRLVHGYDTIDSVIVHGSIKKVLQYFPMYQKQVGNYLDSLEAENG